MIWISLQNIFFQIVFMCIKNVDASVASIGLKNFSKILCVCGRLFNEYPSYIFIFNKMFIAIVISHTIRNAGQSDAALSDRRVRKLISRKIIMGKLLYFITSTQYRTVMFDEKAEKSLSIYGRGLCSFVITCTRRHFEILDIINIMRDIIIGRLVIRAIWNALHKRTDWNFECKHFCGVSFNLVENFKDYIRIHVVIDIRVSKIRKIVEVIIFTWILGFNFWKRVFWTKALQFKRQWHAMLQFFLPYILVSQIFILDT